MNAMNPQRSRGSALVLVMVLVSLLAMLLAQNRRTLFNLGEELSGIEEQQKERLSD